MVQTSLWFQRPNFTKIMLMGPMNKYVRGAKKRSTFQAFLDSRNKYVLFYNFKNLNSCELIGHTGYRNLVYS